MKAKTVWVVDDDVSIGWVLEKALNNNGYKVNVFRGVKPLLQALKYSQPDVVISDIQMPGIDGLKLLELLHENFPTIPVIIMTAYSDFETTITSYKKGAFEYLAKPFDIEKVQILVKQALSHHDLLDSQQLGSRRLKPWQQAFLQHVEVSFERGQQNVSGTLYREIDKLLIKAALAETAGHKQKAAKLLGWGRNTLTRKMQDLRL